MNKNFVNKLAFPRNFLEWIFWSKRSFENRVFCLGGFFGGFFPACFSEETARKIVLQIIALPGNNYK